MYVSTYNGYRIAIIEIYKIIIVKFRNVDDLRWVYINLLDSADFEFSLYFD